MAHAFGTPRARQQKKLRYKFIKFIFLCNFMSLDYELVVFASSFKFINFILMFTLYNSGQFYRNATALGISPAGSSSQCSPSTFTNVHKVHNVHSPNIFSSLGAMPAHAMCTPMFTTCTFQRVTERALRLLRPRSEYRDCRGAPNRQFACATSKILLSQVHEVHSALAVMKLDSELVTFPHVHDVHEVHDVHDVHQWPQGLKRRFFYRSSFARPEGLAPPA
jgi:hypothetical protein